MSRLHQSLCFLPARCSCFFVILTTLLISGCDGGLFGTGDGSDSLDLADQVSSDDTTGGEGGGQSGNAGGNDTSNGSVGAPDNNDPGFTTEQISFNNATPAGLPSTSTTLPGVKLINLSATELLLTISSAQNVAINSNERVQAASTSNTRLLNNTGNEVSVQISDTGDDVLLISPLTTASDSLTTILVGNQPGSTRIVPYVFDTRAAEPQPGINQIRLISLIDNSGLPDTPLTFFIEPAADSDNGANLQLNDEISNDLFISEYAPLVAGRYTIRVSNNAFSPTEIELRDNEVYSLIITPNPQAPVYLENDTENP